MTRAERQSWRYLRRPEYEVPSVWTVNLYLEDGQYGFIPMSQLCLLPAELPQIHNVLGMRVAGVVDDHRLDVAPFLAFADSD